MNVAEQTARGHQPARRTELPRARLHATRDRESTITSKCGAERYRNDAKRGTRLSADADADADADAEKNDARLKRTDSFPRIFQLALHTTPSNRPDEHEGIVQAISGSDESPRSPQRGQDARRSRFPFLDSPNDHEPCHDIWGSMHETPHLVILTHHSNAP